MKLRVLQVTPEMHPLLKIGGLADVCAALPQALSRLGHDVRVLMPRIRGMPGGRRIARLPGLGTVLEVDGGQDHPVWLLDNPGLRRRSRLYTRADGRPWSDDAQRFDQFARAAVALADDRAGLGWRADVVHGHDWPCGMVAPHMLLQRIPAATVFTIHNLAHQGLFAAATLSELGLPAWLFHPDALEFWGKLSFIKGGLMFSDRLTTVSPRYAQEIRSEAFGNGLDGVLRYRADRLHGILNGLDNRLWNPRVDKALGSVFSAAHMEGRARVKTAVAHELGLDPSGAPLLAMVSRLVVQKGVDLLIETLPALVERGVHVALLGRGEPAIEKALVAAAARFPRRVAVRLGYDDALGRRLYGGSDLFLMPSRFEPCGLAQMIAMRYGSIPVAHATGGLIDTIRDAVGSDGNGFLFEKAGSAELLRAVDRALLLFRDQKAWRAMQQRAMRRRFDWRAPAQAYLHVYRDALACRRV
ncbi:MAG TPA: glycogen synthase GlgA [Xanthomonadaceae bacterium]|nr:glycogen synthase GlgA [Xanthomonadaceae bacterium]